MCHLAWLDLPFEPPVVHDVPGGVSACVMHDEDPTRRLDRATIAGLTAALGIKRRRF